jgi:hypothetical protein
MKTQSIIILLAIAILFPLGGHSQVDSSNKLTIGVEQDFLPYVTGGYFAGGWIGKDHVRARLLTAYVQKPDIFIAKGFTNNRVHAYALVGDYFLKKQWTGWYAGTGLVYWKSSLQIDKKLSTAYYENWLINGTIGYNYKLNPHLYLSPWAGLHLKIAGAKQVSIDGTIYSPPLFNPEASLKIGWKF